MAAGIPDHRTWLGHLTRDAWDSVLDLYRLAGRVAGRKDRAWARFWMLNRYRAGVGGRGFGRVDFHQAKHRDIWVLGQFGCRNGRRSAAGSRRAIVRGWQRRIKPRPFCALRLYGTSDCRYLPGRFGGFRPGLGRDLPLPRSQKYRVCLLEGRSVSNELRHSRRHDGG